jgi:hypothetical protein
MSLTITGRPSGLATWPAVLATTLMRGRVQAYAQIFDVMPHLLGAVEWILTARANSTDGGIPAYFDLLRGRWRNSYPETTGYTIPTLFNCARRLDRPDLHQLAVARADYLLTVRTPEGGVAHWDQENGGTVAPIVFDTGQAIFGWVAAWRETGTQLYLDCAVRAADWLLSVQSPTGAWYRHQHLDRVKVIDTRVAWSLLVVASATNSPAYESAARRNLNWAVSLQLANGWFRHAAFDVASDPFTHTIAYTAEGLLESGLLLSEPSYLAAAEKVGLALLAKLRPDGWLASSYNESWESNSRSSCLTGNCQVALLWMRLFEQSGDAAYLDAAQRTLTFVASTQDLTTGNPFIRGAIGGSLPMYGSYERLKYPNWAAKFFIDALLMLERMRTDFTVYGK